MQERTQESERAIVGFLGSLQVGKLAVRRERGHWNKYSNDRLLELASDEMQELADALDLLRNASTESERRRLAYDVLSECADVANFIAFIAANAADRHGV